MGIYHDGKRKSSFVMNGIYTRVYDILVAEEEARSGEL